MFNHSWGAMLELPYTFRYFKTEEDNGQIQGFNYNSTGDIQIAGTYTGLSEDMSTGLLLGVKVPSGWWSYPNTDRDTEIGTGSTDLLVGVYHLGTLPSQLGPLPLTLMERPFNWFGQVYYDLPALHAGPLHAALNARPWEPPTTSARSDQLEDSLRC